MLLRMSTPSQISIIFGATGGIGHAVAEARASQGDTLVIVARDAERLKSLAAATGATAYTADATQEDQVSGIIQAVVDQYGRVDAVANLVGSLLLKPAHLTTADEWHQTLRQNLDTAFFVTKHAAKAMMKTGGSIVLMSSAVAQKGLTNHEAIAAAKAGVAGLARGAAATYAKRGIRVNAVMPGLTETPMTARLTQNEASKNASAAMHAMGRIGAPSDVAPLVSFLLDASSSAWVTGQCIGADGGLSVLQP